MVTPTSHVARGTWHVHFDADAEELLGAFTSAWWQAHVAGRTLYAAERERAELPMCVHASLRQVARPDGASSRTTGASGASGYAGDGDVADRGALVGAHRIGPRRAPEAGDRSTRPNSARQLGETRLGPALKPFELVEGADDAERAVAEVHSHRRALLAHHAPEPVGLVGDPVVEFEALDHRLGLRLEGTAGEVAPLSPGSSCHHPQYAPSKPMPVSPAGTFGRRPRLRAGASARPRRCLHQERALE